MRIVPTMTEVINNAAPIRALHDKDIILVVSVNILHELVQVALSLSIASISISPRLTQASVLCRHPGEQRMPRRYQEHLQTQVQLTK